MTVSKAKMAILQNALSKMGLEFTVTRVEGDVAHVNIWVGETDE